MRVSFYNVMAVAALGATGVLSIGLNSSGGHLHQNNLENDGLDLAQQHILPEGDSGGGHSDMIGMEVAQIGNEGEFLGGLGGMISGATNAIGGMFKGKKN